MKCLERLTEMGDESIFGVIPSFRYLLRIVLVRTNLIAVSVGDPEHLLLPEAGSKRKLPPAYVHELELVVRELYFTVDPDIRRDGDLEAVEDGGGGR
jgi:hypothetical protein